MTDLTSIRLSDLVSPFALLALGNVLVLGWQVIRRARSRAGAAEGPPAASVTRASLPFRWALGFLLRERECPTCHGRLQIVWLGVPAPAGQWTFGLLWVHYSRFPGREQMSLGYECEECLRTTTWSGETVQRAEEVTDPSVDGGSWVLRLALLAALTLGPPLIALTVWALVTHSQPR